MTRYSELRREAVSLSEDGQYQAAHLLFLQAAHEAFLIGHFSDRVVCLGNALISGKKAKIRSPARLAILMDIRTQLMDRPDSAPTDLGIDFRGWVASEYFDYLDDTFPSRVELESCFEDLGTLHPADVHHHWSRFYSLRGEFTNAAASAERAWAEISSKSNGAGLHTPSYLLRGYYTAMENNAADRAKQWLEGAVRELSSHRCVNCKMNCLIAEVDCALATSAPLADLRKKIKFVEAHDLQLQALPHTIFCAVRGHLRDSGNGDPFAAMHPAWRSLARRLPGDDSGIMNRYSRTLLILDVRLAAVRYSVGMPPVDDDHYAERQDLTGCKSGSDTNRRLRKARQAALGALRYAAKIDNLLECTWRQNAVRQRIERVEEIERHLCRA